MYRYVPKNEVMSYRRKCSRLLNALLHRLKSEMGSAQFTLVGSGGKNLVVSNGEGPYDLDYNLCFSKLPDKWASNPKKMKNCIRNILDSLITNEFSDGKDSTSVITYLVFQEAVVVFHLDIGILMNGAQGWSRLVQDKERDVYT